MSKLLKEATIRRFMALANIETLSDGFVNEGSYGGNMGDESESHRDYMKEEEDELEATEDELGAEDEMADMEGDEVDDLEADMDVEMVDDEEVVAEVLKRVSARLREAVKKSKRSKITRK
mgnify:FL=1